MENITLKRATLEDFNEVFNIERSANSSTYFARTTEKEAKEYLTNDVVYLIKRGNIVVGIVSFENKTAEHAHISGLVVKPEFHGQGIGRQAMASVLAELKDRKRIDLTVHPHNNPAVGLYLSLGFIIESWKDNHFGDGEPRLVMVYQR
jgi:ribosomal protein S18 acetylase RimI-like enzyme